MHHKTNSSYNTKKLFYTFKEQNIKNKKNISSNHNHTENNLWIKVSFF